jgi:glycosyltransferase involved in cell wall biosynthesis
MPDPLVSFVMATYNGAAFLHDALRSLAAQTHRRIEIVLVDDGSTDDSAAIADAWSVRDGRIRLIRAGHQGPQHARNTGVAEARGAFVAHMDQDDVAAPSRVACQLAWMEAHGIDVCGSCTRVFGDARYLGWVPERHEDILRESVFRCALPHSTVMLPAAIAKANPFDPRRSCGGDELPIRLSARHVLGNVQQPLIKYRHHGGQRARLETDAVRAARRAIGRDVFRRLFPDAGADDETAVMHVADARPFDDVAEEARAARWMARLSATDDPMVRRLMSERWTAMRRQS